MLKRAGIIVLAASAMTALWAAIILGGAWLIGAALERTLFLSVLACIFAIAVFAIALAKSAGSPR